MIKQILLNTLLLFVGWKPLGTLANSEDPYEMLLYAVFNLGLHCSTKSIFR